MGLKGGLGSWLRSEFGGVPLVGSKEFHSFETFTISPGHNLVYSAICLGR